jgi:hypothetical protein
VKDIYTKEEIIEIIGKIPTFFNCPEYGMTNDISMEESKCEAYYGDYVSMLQLLSAFGIDADQYVLKDINNK